MFFLSRIGVVSSGSMSGNRKYAVVIIFIASAVFTPPDVISQFMMALPLMIFYEASVLLVRRAEKNKNRLQ
jgi:sec-independent protein translocase protein TatC